jgi:isopentenyl-diphosphate delta-isomerase
VDLAPNPEEVQGVRYVTQEELAAMMGEGSGLQWSPWFRIIAQHLLPAWWGDLPGALRGGEHDDFGTIHRLSC